MPRELPEQEIDRGVVENKMSVERENAGSAEAAEEELQQDASEGNVDQGHDGPSVEGNPPNEDEASEKGTVRTDIPASEQE